MGEMRICKAVIFWLEALYRKNHSENLCADGRILKCFLGKQDLLVWIGFIWLRTELVANSCKHGNELLRSAKVEIG
jgi:hypothetical protein